MLNAIKLVRVRTRNYVVGTYQFYTKAIQLFALDDTPRICVSSHMSLRNMWASYNDFLHTQNTHAYASLAHEAYKVTITNGLGSSTRAHGDRLYT